MKTKRVGRQPKWKNSWYIRVYELAKAGHNNAQISKILGYSSQEYFRREIQRNKALRVTLKKAREDSPGNAVFRDYVYGRLPKRLKVKWDDLQKCEEEQNPIELIEALLSDCGRRTKQHLFLYALVHYNFNLTKALQSLNLVRRTFDLWVTQDPDFSDLIQEIHLAKKDFYEAALVKLVDNGETAAIIFANKTMNADRGYGAKKEVNIKHEGKVTHDHTHTSIPIRELRLPLQERKKLLEAYRKSQKRLKGEE